MKLCTFLSLVLLSACSSSHELNSLPGRFLLAEAQFSKQFPDKYPALPVVIPLEAKNKAAIQEMVKAVASHLKDSGVQVSVTPNHHEVIILPRGTHFLNKKAKRLDRDGIVFKYDGLYFAKNPFSAGSFLEEKKIFLISHSAMKRKERLQDVVGHEFVHVETYSSKNKKIPSLFYCKFKGKQFGPHYLSCDEMNAYHQDLQRLLQRKSSSKLINLKKKHANMHTKPIIDLIDNLFLDTAKIKNNMIIIKGKNPSGPFTMEFPRYSVQKDDPSVKNMAIEYSRNVKKKALQISKFIN